MEHTEGKEFQLSCQVPSISQTYHEMGEDEAIILIIITRLTRDELLMHHIKTLCQIKIKIPMSGVCKWVNHLLNRRVSENRTGL